MASREGDLEHYPRKFGKYHLLAPLAQGGMGALYLAVTGDRGLERLMVIKTVLPHLADAEYVARFRDEAKVVVKLSHGNLIPVFDAGVVGGEMFLAMDFVEGRDLRAVWNRCAKKQVAFPIDVAVYIVKELCRGLAYAHSFPDLNLVHRDISPPNVLVSYTGEVKLTDFGLASSTLKLEKTAPGIIYGKVAYMSPEQARGEKLDGRSDMYATGIVLWELLTGRQLFPPGKDQPQDLLARAKNPDPMRPSKRAPRVPTDLDDICLKALAPAKEDRYADCDQMRMALQAWLAHNAPTTDGTRMSTFLHELFADDIVRERAERTEMVSRIRTRALTLPPTDELRQMIEKSEPFTVAELAAAAEAPVRKPGSVGRRASDRNETGEDRRKSDDRRVLAARASSPAVGAGKGNDGSGALSAAALKEEMAPELDVGSDVDGRYRIVELIGEGGMGKVYLAEHVEIGKRVALKVLHPSYSRMPDLVERFRREARAASKIGHPNIVDVTDSGSTADGSVYFVMEYLEGVELGSVIEREGPIDVSRALRIAGQISRALAAAHREGIIHRDLKPENIYLITRGGEADVVKVLDFGIAKTTEAEAARERRLTSPGMAMGTPEYMAPEQAAGRAADARTDIYSLGAIMYEMVTGVPPYSGDNFMEILTKKATQDPPPPNEVRVDLPSQVSDLVRASMARDPADRPPTMEALEYELNKCLSGRGVAVAQILGMTTDAHVVASLNPGLSMRNLEEGMVAVSRASTANEIWDTRSGISSRGMKSGPIAVSSPGIATRQSEPVIAASGSGQMGTAASPGGGYPRAQTPAPGSLSSTTISTEIDAGSVRPRLPSQQGVPLSDAVSAPAQVIVHHRSGMAVFGWVMLVLMVLGGGGALAYFLFIQNGDKAAANGASVGSAPTTGSGGVEIAPPPPPSQHDGVGSAGSAAAPNAGSATAGSGSGSGSTVQATGSGAGSDDHKRPPQHNVKDHDPHHPTVAVTSSNPKDLLKQAQDLEHAQDWETVKTVWEKLEKTKAYQYPGFAAYKQAWAAFQLKDTTAALELAQRAAGMPGNQKLDAQLLAGDALYKQNEYDRAKTYYLSVRGKLTGEKKTQVTNKIISCNQKLGKPERDGIVGN